jgi:hypothetical protein
VWLSFSDHPVLVVRSMDWAGLKILRPDRRKLATAIKDNVQANYKAAGNSLPASNDQM